MPSTRSLSHITDPDSTWDSDRVMEALPKPEFPAIDKTKKSHARKQAPGHIPRPRNPFILFRSNFVRQQVVKDSVENDHRNISRIVGKLWNAMTEEQKEPWTQMGVREREEHARQYPGYRFTPGVPGSNRKKKAKRGDLDKTELRKMLDDADPVQKVESPEYHFDHQPYSPPRRPSSCPPGARHIPQVEGLDHHRTRDDLSRRPSKFTLYQSYDSPYSQGCVDLPDLQLHHQYQPHEQIPHPDFFSYPGSPSSAAQYNNSRYDQQQAAGPFISSSSGYNNEAADHHYDPQAWSSVYDSPNSNQPLSQNPYRSDMDHFPEPSRSPPPIFLNPFGHSGDYFGDSNRYESLEQQILRLNDPTISPITAAKDMSLFPFAPRKKSSLFLSRKLPPPVPHSSQKNGLADTSTSPFSFDNSYRKSSRSWSVFLDNSEGSLARTLEKLNHGHSPSEEVELPRLIGGGAEARSPTDSTVSPRTIGDASP